MTTRKIMLLGEIGVGKSSLVRRLVFDTFDMNYKPTIGVDVYRYDVPATDTQSALSLVIWDTDGNLSTSIFKHIYMRQAQAAVIVADVTRSETLDVQKSLAEGFRDAFPGRPVGFVINKVDLLTPSDDFIVPPHLTQGGISLTRTSARTGADVKNAFHTAADAILRRNL